MEGLYKSDSWSNTIRKNKIGSMVPFSFYVICKLLRLERLNINLKTFLYNVQYKFKLSFTKMTINNG
jgi:hypothetical protein